MRVSTGDLPLVRAKTSPLADTVRPEPGLRSTLPGVGSEGAALPADPGALVGVVVQGRYRIEAVLGEGGMGTVYRARHVSLGKSFALKLLRREIAHAKESVERFVREAKIAAEIEHENLIAITDFGELSADDVPTMGEARQPYFVMELLEGETLGKALMRGVRFDARTAAFVFGEVARGLAAAHERGVVHRDLKPDNIFLLEAPARRETREGPERPRVKVLDFGVAKLASAARLTRGGTVFGTPFYMAPEQASGGEVDARSDQYALGVVLYEVLAGRVPFDGESYHAVMTKHLEELPPPLDPQEAPSPALSALERIVARCLEKDPAKRYGSTRELARAFREAAAEIGDPTGLTPPAPAARASDAVSPAPGSSRLAFAVGVLALLAIVLGVIALRR